MSASGSQLGPAVTDPKTIAMLSWLEKNQASTPQYGQPSIPVSRRASYQSSATSLGPPVTDPATIAQLEKIESQQSSKQSSALQPIGKGPSTLGGMLAQNINSPTSQGILGASDAVHNSLANIANLDPEENISPMQSGSGTAYNVGKFAGNVLPYAAGGEALSGLRLGAETIPYAGKIAQYLGKSGIGQAVSRAAANAGYGASQDPGNRTGGAESGAAWSGASEIIPAIGAGLYSLNPDKYTKGIVSNLGQGSTNLEQNSQALSSDIKNAYDQRVAEASAQYTPVLQKYGDQSIYPSANPSGISFVSTVPKIPDAVSNSDTSAFINNFNSNPTLQNAHALQSQIGVEIGAAQKGMQDQASRSYISTLSNTRDTIKNGIDNFLTNIADDPAAAQQYQNGSDLFKQNVVPYRSDPVLSAISQGRETNPKNIHSIFEYPTNIVNKEGTTQLGPINKVMQDLPSTAPGQILYSKINAPSANVNAGNIANKIESARDSGYSSYVTPDIENSLNALKNVSAKRSVAMHLGGAALGSLAGYSSGGDSSTNTMLGVIGGLLGNNQMAGAMSSAIPKGIGSGLADLYRPTANSLLANKLSSSNTNSGANQ